MNDTSLRSSTDGSGALGTRARRSVLWVAWRQQRFQLLASLGVIGAVALGLVILRLNVVGALEEVGGDVCYQVDGQAACQNPALGWLPDHYLTIASLVPLLMIALPPLLGALTGGPLFAREFEQGTQILALTQSVRPVQWWAVKTAVAGIPVALAMLALGFVNRWAMAPMVGFVSSAMGTPGFETRGVTPSVYFVLAYSIAVTAGILLRNTAAAVGSTVLVFVAIVLMLGVFRPNYLSPETAVMSIPADAGDQDPFVAGAVAWQVDGYVVNASGERITVRTAECPAPTDYQQCMVDQGAVAEIIEYQTPDRYWPIQAIEAALTLTISAIILLAGLFRLRRNVL